MNEPPVVAANNSYGSLNEESFYLTASESSASTGKSEFECKLILLIYMLFCMIM